MRTQRPKGTFGDFTRPDRELMTITLRLPHTSTFPGGTQVVPGRDPPPRPSPLHRLCRTSSLRDRAMAWNIFGREMTAEQLPAELRTILAEMKRERVAFEALTNAARDSAQSLSQLMQPITDAQKIVSELQARVKSLERSVPGLATLEEQTANV